MLTLKIRLVGPKDKYCHFCDWYQLFQPENQDVPAYYKCYLFPVSGKGVAEGTRLKPDGKETLRCAGCLRAEKNALPLKKK
jgi:hypothetical protein